MLSLISNGCATELGLVRGELENLSREQFEFHDLVAEGANLVSNGLESMRNEVTATREVCDNIGQSLLSWFTEERHSFGEERSSWKKDLLLQLTQRSEKIDELKKMCDDATQLYITKFDQLSNSLATKEEGKQLVQAVMDEFQFVLDHELCRDKAEAEHDSKQTQYTLANLETQIGTVIDQLKRNETQVRDTHNQETISSFKEMIQGLQSEAKVTADLRNRWHSDVRLIDSMRSKLESMQSLMPHIDQCHQTIDNMTDLGDIIEHTSKYIDQEHQWVRHQLREQAEGNIAAATKTATPRPGQPEQGHAGLTNTEGNCIERRVIDVQSHSETAFADLAHLGLHETTKKRVHVHSPIESFFPANALSVEQEKRRRRDPINVPSILKSNGSSSTQETMMTEYRGNKTETELGLVHECRKVPTQAASLSEEKHRIIHEIGSSFLTASDLPRITDYVPLPTALREVTNKQERKTQDDDKVYNGAGIKRVKLS